MWRLHICMTIDSAGNFFFYLHFVKDHVKISYFKVVGRAVNHLIALTSLQVINTAEKILMFLPFTHVC